ncbi:MAG: hypothetical protein K9M07_01520 [Simkaniaceae bacterium]|nr:hypothetical protein [Simkaniaceae bacterium]
MHRFDKLLELMGKALIAVFFIWRGGNQIINWSMTEKNFIGDVINWHVFVSDVPGLDRIAESILPFTMQLIILGIVLQLVCGFMLLISWKDRLAVSILSIYLLINNFFTHYFWMAEGYRKEILLEQFMQSLSIIGGILLIVALQKIKRILNREHLDFLQTAATNED